LQYFLIKTLQQFKALTHTKNKKIKIPHRSSSFHHHVRAKITTMRALLFFHQSDEHQEQP